MIILVRSLASWCKLSMIWALVLLSSALVASSARRIGAFLSMTRLIDTRCFSPPDSLSPRSPTWVSYPSGSILMRWSRLARRHTSSTRSGVAFAMSP
mmetsp:Transcript_16033/g.40593  ORF Transcript_16033/g.40593 Transcript_16033/m.40593 type:complete len:97 (+) Transcript_16033:257-547(+)